MNTRCGCPARDAAATRFLVATSSSLRPPAQCTITSAPATAAGIPSFLSRSPVTYSAPLGGVVGPELALRGVVGPELALRGVVGPELALRGVVGPERAAAT